RPRYRRSERHDAGLDRVGRVSKKPGGFAEKLQRRRLRFFYELRWRKRKSHSQKPPGLPFVFLAEFGTPNHHQRNGPKKPTRNFRCLFSFPAFRKPLERSSFQTKHFGAEPRFFGRKIKNVGRRIPRKTLGTPGILGRISGKTRFH